MRSHRPTVRSSEAATQLPTSGGSDGQIQPVDWLDLQRGPGVTAGDRVRHDPQRLATVGNVNFLLRRIR
jgi:hypothetical protein